jgi:non-heme chloroperoxidase
MMGGIKAHYNCIKAFSETDFTEDLKKIEVPTFVMHGRRPDRSLRIAGPLSAKLLKNAETKFYPGFPHGMPTTNAEQINTDLLAFIRHEQPLWSDQSVAPQRSLPIGELHEF